MENNIEQHRQTILTYGSDKAIEAWEMYENDEGGANTIGSYFAGREASNGFCTVVGDRLIDCGRWLKTGDVW
jgi:hypothetical protein